ncbi:hypothetical protein BJY04DRAFT_221509 [Aspergillus karnatakaensis]|uniref:glycosyl hydrolase family 79 C-terminal domain-containing protein n=1 Tax=Aspergillus karnatakaensis TaxID=1810916 RepID=UPI003CCD5BEC
MKIFYPVFLLPVATFASLPSVSKAPPPNISEPIGEAFVSFSIEFSWFPEYAGNKSNPNRFSSNLLANFEQYTGHRPYVRVGGNTQDNALYDPDLEVATDRTFGNPDISYPTSARFSHGFNMGANSSNGGFDNLEATLPLACAAIKNSQFAHWEVGNEADHYAQLKSNRPPIREESTWDVTAYVADWKERIETLARIYRKASGSQDPTVTLQGTLMNHSMTAAGLASQLSVKNSLRDVGLPYIIGEGNSLFSQGRRGCSDVFGAALWSIDFSLLAASIGIHRVHFHQGVDYNYASWQPVNWGPTVPATRAPYYGTIAAAAILGHTDRHKVQVSPIPMPEETESAYAIYRDGKLARIAIINMVEYNSSTASDRPSKDYSSRLPDSSRFIKRVPVQRLVASGSDAVSGITWDGYSYNYELRQGRPTRLHSVTTSRSEAVWARNSIVSVTLPHSSYAVLNFL